MRPAQSVASITMAIVLLLLGAGNALAVTMKAVLSGTFTDQFITYDYGVFGDGSEGTLTGLPFRITFLYSIDDIDINTGGIGGVSYGTVDPITSAILQAGNLADPTKSYNFETDQSGEVRLNDQSNALIMLFSSSQSVLNRNYYFNIFIVTFISATYTNKDGELYKGPQNLSESFVLIGDTGFPIGGFGFVIYDKSQSGYVSYGTAYIDRLEITNADDVPPSIVPVPHALPLLASALVAIGAFATRRPMTARRGLVD